MHIERTVLDAHHADPAIATLRKSCIGCAGCTGPCRALLEMASLPKVVLALRAGR